MVTVRETAWGLIDTFRQDGKPYIISNEANRVINTSEERTQGYTIAVQATFANREDVEYYDKECEAHKALRALATPKRTGIAMLLFESDLKPGEIRAKL